MWSRSGWYWFFWSSWSMWSIAAAPPPRTPSSFPPLAKSSGRLSRPPRKPAGRWSNPPKWITPRRIASTISTKSRVTSITFKKAGRPWDRRLFCVFQRARPPGCARATILSQYIAVQRDADRAVIRTHDLWVNLGGHQKLHRSRRRQHIIDAPAHIARPTIPPVGPPGIVLRLVAKMAEGIGPPGVQPLLKGCAFLGAKPANFLI